MDFLDQVRKQLIQKITFYYGSIIVVMGAISLLLPQWLEYLPVGGLNELVTGDNFNSIEDEILSSYSPVNTWKGAIQLATAQVGAILVMLPIRWAYFSTDFGNRRNSIAANLILLPIVVTGIVAIVQNSLALAFSLAGIVAGVSYRTRLKDSTDALFIFAAIGVGLAAGTLALGIGMVMAMFFSFTVLLLPSGEEGVKPVQVGEQDASENEEQNL